MTDQGSLAATISKRSPRRRFLRRPSRFVLLTSIVLVLVALIVVAPSAVAPYDPATQVTRDRLKPPLSVGRTGQQYILGSDHLGRDLLSRIIYGMRVATIIGVTAVAIAVGVGCSVALLAGFRGGVIDDTLMRLADIQQAFPFILLAIAVIGVLGPSLGKVIIVLGIANWVMFARVIRSEVLSLRAKDFVEAARSIGASDWRIIVRHILPSVIPSIIVVSTFTLSSVIVAEAGLSFLALGVPPSTPSWGGMLVEGREYVDTAWWLSVFPGAAIFVLVFAINYVGDYLRDVFDPHVQRR